MARCPPLPIVRCTEWTRTATAIRVVNQAAVAFWLAFVQSLFQRVQHEVRAHRTANAPAHDAPGEHIDDEGHV